MSFIQRGLYLFSLFVVVGFDFRFLTLGFAGICVLVLVYVLGKLFIKLRGMDADGETGLKLAVIGADDVDVDYLPTKRVISANVDYRWRNDGNII